MRVTSSARSRWRSAIASSRSISSSERTGATVPLCRKRSARGGSRKKKGNAPQFGLREGLFRMTGTDLTRIDGIDVMTATTVISEAGYDMSKWQTENHFVSWLRLCPDNRISGNKVIGKGRLPTNNPNCLEDGGHHVAGKQNLSRSAIPSTANQTRRSHRHQGHGGQASPLGLPHAALRDEIRGPRSSLLRASTPRVTDQAPQGQSRKARIPSHPNTGRGLTRVSEENSDGMLVCPGDRPARVCRSRRLSNRSGSRASRRSPAPSERKVRNSWRPGATTWRLAILMDWLTDSGTAAMSTKR